ncbi:MAG: type I-E CRISPR-associated protein Cas6/Cse3/CasE [Proteobacteria bacterium]|nr:type I-E CRISPR-associated protein Cas6/Cse3/CasE [Pseudomonadota bacterium]
MHLSRLTLEHPPRSRDLRRDLASPYEMHRTLYRAFPAPGRMLFRLDTSRRPVPPVVLVQSESAPDWSFLKDMTGYIGNMDAKPYDPVFSPGQVLRFRLRANPTKKTGTTSKADRLAGALKSNGKRLALFREEDQRAWIGAKAGAGGFSLDPDSLWLVQEDSAQAMVKGWKEVNGNRRGLSLYSVLFEGFLSVTEPELFRLTLEAGVGPGKGLGFGLLSVAPA